MKKKLLDAALKAAPLVLGAAPTTRDLRGAAVERAARWAAERVTSRKTKKAVRELREEAVSAGEKVRARLRREAPRRHSGAAGVAAKGLAAAAVALPLGLWVGSRLRERV